MEFTGYSSLWKAIIRPPRSEYSVKDLGPPEFKISGMKVVRTDLQIKNKRGHQIHCSHFEPLETDREWNEMPCIIYMHGNSSSRLEALECVPFILPARMTLFCFDFAGAGLSDGEYISLGWWERDDVQ